jgi:hypothetical protein
VPRTAARTTRTPAALETIPLLRALALLLGALVLLAHLVTIRLSSIIPNWLAVDWPDLAKHFSLVGSFALVYRLSLRRSGAGGLGAVFDAPGAAWRTIGVCSSWAGVCELLQFRHPYRDFSVIELSLNILTPVLIAGLIELLNPRHLRD